MVKKSKEPSFEERLARLQTIVTALESGNSPLEESVALYKEGLSHATACRDQLAAARHDLEILGEGAGGISMPAGATASPENRAANAFPNSQQGNNSQQADLPENDDSEQEGLWS